MDMPVLEGLLKYAQEKNIPFHMPGHKNNLRGFRELEDIKNNLYEIDLTEVPGTDNLHCPEDILLIGEQLAARAFEAYKSYFLVNGSTCGIYSMILGTTKPGDKIILQRNCHRSVFTACLMGDLEAVYVTPAVVPDYNIPGGLEVSQIRQAIEANPDAKAVVITCPSYYGICSNIKEIAQCVHQHNMLLLVDEAHGAHLGFTESLPQPSISIGADVSVISLHKSLPAMTQCSLLNVSKGIATEGIEFMLKVFQTTSPSYILMASIDAARYIMETNGKKLLDELLDYIDEFRKKAKSLQDFKLLGSDLCGSYGIYSIDKTKLVIGSSFGGRKLEKLLRSDYSIQVEMSDINNALLIGAVGDTRYFYDRLYAALSCMDGKYSRIDMLPCKEYPAYVKAVSMRQAYYSPKERIRLKDSCGRICCELVAPYPPGIPVLLPGEVITKESIEYILLQIANGITINGIEDSSCEYINVIK